MKLWLEGYSKGFSSTLYSVRRMKDVPLVVNAVGPEWSSQFALPIRGGQYIVLPCIPSNVLRLQFSAFLAPLTDVEETVAGNHSVFLSPRMCQDSMRLLVSPTLCRRRLRTSQLL